MQHCVPFHNLYVCFRATLWYVPLTIKAPHEVVDVPPLTYSDTKDEQRGHVRYERQKISRAERKSVVNYSQFAGSLSTITFNSHEKKLFYSGRK